MRIFTRAASCTLAIFFAISTARADFNFVTLNDPLGAQGTYATAISGSNIVGYYQDNKGKYHGFEYNGSSYVTIDEPLGTGIQGTQIYGIAGSILVGSYQESTGRIHGFTYNGSFTTFDNPSTNSFTDAYGKSGNTIVGTWTDSNSHSQSYTYDGSTFSNFSAPGAFGTAARGIDGSTIVGLYQDTNGAHGFSYDGTNFTTLDYPSSNVNGLVFSVGGTLASGISNGIIVGTVLADTLNLNNPPTFSVGAEYGFIYDGTTYTKFVDPNANESFGYGTVAQGIDGNNVVGYYYDSLGIHGFETTIPEPTIGLCMIASFVALTRRR